MFSEIIFPKIEINKNLGIFDENINMDDEQKIFRPYLQIFKNSEIIYNSLSSDPSASDLKTYKRSDISCWFNINCDVNL